MASNTGKTHRRIVFSLRMAPSTSTHRLPSFQGLIVVAVAFNRTAQLCRPANRRTPTGKLTEDSPHYLTILLVWSILTVINPLMPPCPISRLSDACILSCTHRYLLYCILACFFKVPWDSVCSFTYGQWLVGVNEMVQMEPFYFHLEKNEM